MNIKDDLIYLASLYSLDTIGLQDPLREIRYQRVMALTARMLNDGWLIFSPIVYCHKMSLVYTLPGEWPFWERLDRTFIKACDRVFVLKDSGLERSVGVNAEIKIGQELNKPVHFVSFDGTTYQVEPCTVAS